MKTYVLFIKDLVNCKGRLEMFVICSYIMDFSVTIDVSSSISIETSKKYQSSHRLL